MRGQKENTDSKNTSTHPW